MAEITPHTPQRVWYNVRFLAVLVFNWFSILAIVVSNKFWNSL